MARHGMGLSMDMAGHVEWRCFGCSVFMLYVQAISLVAGSGSWYLCSIDMDRQEGRESSTSHGSLEESSSLLYHAVR